MSEWESRLEALGEDHAFQREVAVGRSSAALAQLIGQRMHEEGMTQVELARRLGISESALSRKLNNGVDMRLSSVTAILWELGIALHRQFEQLGESSWRGLESSGPSATVIPFPAARRLGQTVRVEPGETEPGGLEYAT